MTQPPWLMDKDITVVQIENAFTPQGAQVKKTKLRIQVPGSAIDCKPVPLPASVLCRMDRQQSESFLQTSSNGSCATEPATETMNFMGRRIAAAVWLFSGFVFVIKFSGGIVACTSSCSIFRFAAGCCDACTHYSVCGSWGEGFKYPAAG